MKSSLVRKGLVCLMFVLALAVAQPGSAGAIEPGLREAIQTSGQGAYIIVLRGKADLGPAYGITDWVQRGEFVYDTLRSFAAQSQAGLIAALEADPGVVSFQPFFIRNAVYVVSGVATLDAVAARPEVEEIVAERFSTIPEPVIESTVLAPEWGINMIRAPELWAQGVRGAGVVVANVDTGVQYDHPAVVNQYRGTHTGSNDYNFYDPTGSCSGGVCDNNGHGTHTMGTMVGDDGGTNQIGVATEARWIAAKGCASSSCSDLHLTLSAQWIVAPCAFGQAPGHASCDPAQRPHIVNNSWGGGPGGGDPWYQSYVDAWRAAGIIPVFSAGNSGPGASTLGSPGDYCNVIGVGGTNSSDGYYTSTSWGPGAFPACTNKPDMSAPGQSVRSAIPTNNYATYSGTSMAAPHVSGCIAMMLSVDPSLTYSQIFDILTQTAVDLGAAGFDYIFGNGRIDCFEAVQQLSPDFRLQADPTSASACIPAGATFDIDVISIAGYDEAVTLSANNVPAGYSAGFSVNPVTAPGTSVMTLSNIGAAVAGAYTIEVVGTAITSTHSVDVDLVLFDAAPGGVTLTAPADGAANVGTSPTFSWTAATQALTYELEVATDNIFTNVVYTATVTGTTHASTAGLAPLTTHYWRVRALNDCGTGANSGVFTFTTAPIICNPASITIPSSGAATPYPSSVAVGGLDTSLTSVKVHLYGMNHTYPDDIDILLVGPQGQNLIIMSDAGGSNDLVNVDLTFDDAAANPLPDSAQIVSGEYRPTNYGTGDTFPAPAPAPSAATQLAVFTGTDPNGTWNLYVVDDASGDSGTIAGGWCLEISSEQPPEEPEIAVDPTSLSALQLPDTVTQQTLEIGNVGNAPLNWMIDEEPAAITVFRDGDAAKQRILAAEANLKTPAAGASISRGGAPGPGQPIAYEIQANFGEGFDDITVLPGQGWFFQNNSSPLGSTSWFQGNDTVFPAHAGAATAYIGANYNNTAGTGTISNWMLTPEIELYDGDELSFWTRTADGSTWADRLQVRLSTAGASTNVGTLATDVGDFTTLLLDINPTLVGNGYPQAWTQYTVTLAGIPPGATGRLAFRYFVTNGGPSGANSNYIGIDTVEYSSSVASPCANPADVPWLSASPITGSTGAGMVTPVDVTFDSTGLAVGVYGANLCITSNDAANPLVVVPVELEVVDTLPSTITLAKTVGTSPLVCAATSAITVPPDTEVTYCFEVTNTGGTTLNLHDLVDTELGSILSGFSYALAPGASAFLTQSATISVTTVNTATWTAYNAGPTDVATASAVAVVNVSDEAPAIELTKTVGTVPGVCAATTEITVTAGTQVYYCYQAENTGNVSFNFHDLNDSALGTILNDFPYTLAPGAFSPEVIVPATPMATVTNTATWTAVTALGDYIADDTIAYNWQDISGTGTPLSLGDDDLQQFPIGFTFEYYGVPYSNFYVSSNGFLSAVSTGNGCCTGGILPATATPNGVIAGWWEDLNPTAGGTVHYQTLGSAPNRVLILQFTNVPHFGGGNEVTVQYKLFETTNTIEVHYQAAPSDGGTHSAGIENQDGTVGIQYYRGTAALPTPLAVRYELATTFSATDQASATVNVLVPNIDVDPLSMAASQPANTTTQQILSVANTGEGDLTWTIAEEPTATVAPMLTGGDIEQAFDTVDPSDFKPQAPQGPPAALTGWVTPHAVLYDNGPLVTHPGGGAGGADVSALQSALGMNTYGAGHQVSAGNRVADDFTITGGGWFIENITFFAYQTGSSTVSTMTAVNLRIWNGPPNDPASMVVFGDTTTNRMTGTIWSNIYRTLDTNLGDSTRPIMASTVAVNTFLPAGTYWLDWQTDGTLSSGPWAPPITILGQTTTGNALQYTSTGWAALVDTGTTTPQGFPFIIEGSSECADLSDVPWLSTAPSGGSNGAGVSTPVTVTFDSTGLALGTYTANLCVFSNDPDPGPGNGTALIVVPVTLEVTEALEPADVTGTKTVSGNFTVGGAITYTIVLSNAGPGDQGDNPGDEFSDTLPAELTATGAAASSGIINRVGNTVTWNGAIPAGGSVTITITATINPVPGGTVILNQGDIFYDSVGDGENDATRLTDYPGQVGDFDPTPLTVLAVEAIPAAGTLGLLLLLALLGGAGVLVLRRLV